MDPERNVFIRGGDSPVLASELREIFLITPPDKGGLVGKGVLLEEEGKLPPGIQGGVLIRIPGNIRTALLGEVDATIHTDALINIRNWLIELPPEVRAGILIQGRVFPDMETYSRLAQDHNYVRHLEARGHWSGHKPKNTLWRMSPQTDSQRLGFAVGWYPGNILLDIMHGSKQVNTAQPILGGVTEFGVCFRADVDPRDGHVAVKQLRHRLRGQEMTGHVPGPRYADK